jgi:hypothetical protein
LVDLSFKVMQLSHASGLISLSNKLPGVEQLGSIEYEKSVPAMQVTALLPLLRAPDSEQVSVTTVPEATGNCVVVSIVLFHSDFSSLHVAVE